MKPTIICCLLLMSSLVRGQETESRTKQEADILLNQYSEKLKQWNDLVWNHPERSFEERKTVRLLKRVLEKEGFEIEHNISGVKTMFIATYGTEGPVVAILGEYDADENARAPEVPFDQPGGKEKLGYSSGHNLLGIGGLGAALVLKDLIESGKLKGGIKYYGSTAEGGQGGRAYMTRDGHFKGVDMSVFWHPSPVTSANLSQWDALIDMEITIKTKSVLVATQEGEYPDALKRAMDLIDNYDQIREEFDQNLLLHTAMESPEAAYKFNTDFLKLKVRIEHPKQEVALAVLNRINKLITSLDGESDFEAKLNIFRSTHEFIPNLLLQDLVQKNIQSLGAIDFSLQDQRFANKVLTYSKKDSSVLMAKALPYKGADQKVSLKKYGSDIGDVSWLTPTMSFVTTCLPIGASMDNWQGTVFSNSSIGLKGMIYAIKVMSYSIIDYLENEEFRRAVLKEFEERTQGYTYKSLLPSGPPDPKVNSKRS